MATPRFYLPPEFWPADNEVGEVELPDDEAHHARDVLRMRADDALRVFDGLGRTASARFLRAGKREAWVAIGQVEMHPRPVPFLSIAYAPPKGKRASFAVEKLTELGADEIIPLKTARSVSEGGSPEKWEARVIEAAKQCGRAWLPTVGEAVSLEKIMSRINAVPAESAAGQASGQAMHVVDAAADKAMASKWDLALLASPCGSGDGKNAAQALAGAIGKSRRLLWLIGPEGGFTADEEDYLVRAGCLPICLGPHILRIETAAELCAGLTRFLHH